VQIPLGTVTSITEQANPLFSLVNITVTPPATQVGAVNIAGRTVSVRLTAEQPSTHVTFTDQPAPNTGFLIMCKAYQGAPPPNTSWNLSSPGVGSFASSGPACSSLFVAPAGNITVTETVSGNLSLVGITASPPVVSTNLAAKSAVVQIIAGQTTTVIFTNTGNPAPGGQVRVCKVAGQGVPVGTPFTFTVNGNPVTVNAGPGPTGNCSDNFSVPANSNVNIHENVPANYQVASIGFNPGSAAGSTDLPNGNAVAHVGGAGTLTSVIYTNRAVPPEQGLLKVCKIAGPGVAVGAPFTFTASGAPFSVTAGSATSSPPGNCVIVGSFPVGSAVLVDENVPATNQVDEISVEPSAALVSGSVDLTAGSVAVTIGPGVTEVTYTNKRTGFLEVCKAAQGPGVTGNFQFSVAGQLFTVPVGQCTGPIEVPAGQVSVTEVVRPGFQVVTCTTFPVGALMTNCNQPNQTAVVNVAFGGISAQTALTFVNRTVQPGTAAEEPSSPPAPQASASPVSFSTSAASTTSPVDPATGDDGARVVSGKTTVDAACPARLVGAATEAGALVESDSPAADALALAKRLRGVEEGRGSQSVCAG